MTGIWCKPSLNYLSKGRPQRRPFLFSDYPNRSASDRPKDQRRATNHILLGKPKPGWPRQTPKCGSRCCHGIVTMTKYLPCPTWISVWGREQSSQIEAAIPRFDVSWITGRGARTPDIPRESKTSKRYRGLDLARLFRTPKPNPGRAREILRHGDNTMEQQRLPHWGFDVPPSFMFSQKECDWSRVVGLWPITSALRLG